MSIIREYIINFGVEKADPRENRELQNEPKDVISETNVNIEGNFEYKDYSSNSTIGNLKEYFLTTFGKKYHHCKCLLFLYYKTSQIFSQDRYNLFTKEDDKKLIDLEYDTLNLIKINGNCNCKYKDYNKLMIMKKFDIIEEYRQLDLSKKEIYADKINIEQLKKTIEELKEENNKLKKLEELKYHNDPKFEDFYDIVININSIKNVGSEGWAIKFNKNGLDKYNKYKDDNLITMGILGNNNKGKSFILSRISKIKLPTGTSIHTEGLSVKYPDLIGYQGRQIILLDSAGLETPVLKNNNKEKNQNKDNLQKEDDNNAHNIRENPDEDKIEIENNQNNNMKNNLIFKENARDKIVTELFLEHFIITVSDILLVVVGKLTYSEQILINKIELESQRQYKNRIIIIHNLQEFRLVEQVEDYIKNTLLNCTTFNLKKRKWISTKKDKEEKNDNVNEININENNINLNDIHEENVNPEQEDNNNDEIKKQNLKKELKENDIHFTEIINYGNKRYLEIYHLIIANEDSEAGNFYNQHAYNFIENTYNLISTPKKFDIFDMVKKNFTSLSNIILNVDIEKAKFNESKKIIEDKKMELDFKDNLLLKNCYTDELGFFIFKSNNVDIKYNYFKPDEKTLEIRVEIPGNVKIDVNHKDVGDNTIITIKGKKNKDKIPEELKDNLFNLREFGDFEVNIPLKIEEFKINQSKPKEGYPKFSNGICLIQYELFTGGDNTSAEINCDF